MNNIRHNENRSTASQILLIFLAITLLIFIVEGQNPTTILHKQAINVPNLQGGRFFTDPETEYWAYIAYDINTNKSYIRADFRDQTQTDKFKAPTPEIQFNGPISLYKFQKGCGITANFDGSIITPFVINPLDQTITKLNPLQSSTSSLMTLLGISNSNDLAASYYWRFSKACDSFAFQNILIARDPTDSTNTSLIKFSTDYTISAIDQTHSHLIATLNAANPPSYRLYAINRNTLSFDLVGNMQFYQKNNIVVDQRRNIIVGSTQESVGGIYPNGKIVVLQDFSTAATNPGLKVLYEKHSQNLTNIMGFLKTRLLDYFSFSFIHSYGIQSFVAHVDWLYSWVNEFPIQQQVINMSTIRQITADLSQIGIIVLNILPITGNTYQKYLQADIQTRTLKQLGIRNITLSTPNHKVLRVKLIQDGNKKYIYTEKVLGEDPNYIGSYQLEKFQLIANDSNIPSFTPNVMDYETVGFRGNIYKIPGQFQWIFYEQSQTKVSLKGLFFDFKTNTITQPKVDIIGQYKIYATNNEDCSIFQDKNNISNFEIVSINRVAHTLTKLSITNLNAVMLQILSQTSGTVVNSQEIILATSCKGIKVRNVVYYLNVAGDTFLNASDILVTQRVIALDKTMTYAVISDSSDSSIALYRVYTNKTGFSKLIDQEAIQFHFYDNGKILTWVDPVSNAFRIIVIGWRQNVDGKYDGFYYIAAGKDNNLFKIHSMIDQGMQSPPGVQTSPKLTKMSFFYMKGTSLSVVPKTIDFEYKYIQDIKLHPKIQAIIGRVQTAFILQDDFILMRVFYEPSAQLPSLQWIFKFNRGQMLQVLQRAINNTEFMYWQRSLVRLDQGNYYVFTQFHLPVKFTELKIQITKNQIQKVNNTIPNLPQIILTQDTPNMGLQKVGSSRHQLNWAYTSYSEDGKTSVNLIYWKINTNSKTSAQHNFTGVFQAIAGNGISQDCGIFKKKNSNDLIMIKADHSSGTITQMPDIMSVISSININGYPNFAVASQCSLFSLNNKIFRLNSGGNGWDVVTTNNVLFKAFDQRMMYAVAQVDQNSPFKLYKYDSSVPSYIQTTLNYEFLPQILRFQSSGTKIIAVSIAPNSGKYFAKGVVISDNSGTFTTTFTGQSQNLINKPKVFASQTLSKAIFVYDQGVSNIKIYILNLASGIQIKPKIDSGDKLKQLYGFFDLDIYLTDHYAVFHPIPPNGSPTFQEIYFQFYKDEMYLLGANFINPVLAPYWHRTILKQINGQMNIFADFTFPIDNWNENYKIILTQQFIGSITIPVNPVNAPWAALTSGFFEVGGQPNQCISGCADCIDSTSCITCSSGFVLKTGNGQCIPCENNCKKCTEGTPGDCQDCYDGFYKSSTSCLKCQSPCQSCSVSSTNCTSCLPGFTQVNGACQSCPKNCIDCVDDNGVKKCSKCKPGTAVYNGKCRQCLASCSQCDGANIATCYNCDIGFQFAQGSCTKCKDGCVTCSNGVCIICRDQFNNKNGVCYPKCKFPCKDCTDGKPTQCSSCWAGFTMNSTNNGCTQDLACNSDNSCTVCPTKYTLNSTTLPAKCDPCSSGNNCRRCKIADPTTCVQCIYGFYLNDTQACVSCPSSCQSCMNSDVCNTCKSGYLLDQTKCIACQSPCVTCQKSSQHCLSCAQNYTLVGWKCISNSKISFNIRLETDLSSFYSKYQEVRAALIIFINGAGDQVVTFYDLRTGSIVANGSVYLLPNSNASSVYSKMISSFASGSTLAGFSILQSSFQSSEPIQSNQSVNTGLIIGLAVGGTVLLIIIIVISIILCKKCKKNENSIPVVPIDNSSIFQKYENSNMMMQINSEEIIQQSIK